MATLTIRNVPDAIHRALRLRAASTGRSVEAEVRAILATTHQPQSSQDTAARVQQLQQFVARKHKPKGKSGSVVQDFLAERRREAASEP